MVLRWCLGVVAKFLPSTDGVADFYFFRSRSSAKKLAMTNADDSPSQGHTLQTTWPEPFGPSLRLGSAGVGAIVQHTSNIRPTAVQHPSNIRPTSRLTSPIFLLKTIKKLLPVRFLCFLLAFKTTNVYLIREQRQRSLTANSLLTVF